MSRDHRTRAAWFRWRRGAAILMACGSLWFARVGRADDDRQASARDHFRQGVEAAERGDLLNALQHFEQAEALSPSQTVRYNLGQTYTVLGRPVEALRVLRLYLETDSPPADKARRNEIESLIRLNEERMGTIVLTVEPRDAAVQVDGTPIDPTAAGRVPVASGRHVIVATRAGYETRAVTVQVVPRKDAIVAVALTPIPSKRDALLEVTCLVPGAAASLDGIDLGPSTTPRLIAVAAGMHRVRFERLGYQPDDSVVEALPKSITRTRCKLDVEPDLSPLIGAELRVVVNEPRAVVRVDGSPLRSPVLPAGAHRVDVVHPGFEPWQRDVDIPAGKTTTLAVAIVPSAERRRAERAARQRTWALVSGGAGLALGGLSVALLLVNRDRYTEWRTDANALSMELAAGQSSPDQAARAAGLQDRAARIERTDDIAISVGVLGGALLVLSGALLIMNEDHSHEPTQTAAMRSLQWAW